MGAKGSLTDGPHGDGEAGGGSHMTRGELEASPSRRDACRLTGVTALVYLARQGVRLRQVGMQERLFLR